MLSLGSGDFPGLIGANLGTQSATYDERDAILYALAVGAAPERLDLVYERDLRTLPTLSCALGLWAVEAAGKAGVYDPTVSLHVSQQLEMRAPLPARGTCEMTARVAEVWDKGRASIVEVVVESEYFATGYTIFIPGTGGWGGSRGPVSASQQEIKAEWNVAFELPRNQAALYRLTGDRHPVHIDPVVALGNGFERPILHGLCTLAISARIVADCVGAHPADLVYLDGRLTFPVLPGDVLHVEVARSGDQIAFVAKVGDRTVVADGRAKFISRG